MSNAPRKTPHLVAKGGRFYFRMRVPTELVPHIGKSEVTQAIGAVSKPEAVAAAAQLALQWAAHFFDERHRLGLAASPATAPLRAAIPKRIASPDEVEWIAEASAQRRLALDERIRSGRASAEEAAVCHADLADLDRDVTRMLEAGESGGAEARLRADLASHALTLSNDRTDARRMVRAWTAAQSRALKAIGARSRGIAVATPAPVALPHSLQHRDSSQIAPEKKTAEQLRLRDVFELWTAQRQARPAKTTQKAAQAVARFESLTGNPALALLDRSGGAEFRRALVAAHTSAKTASDQMGWVQTLLNFELAHHGRIVTNPWKGLGIDVQRARAPDVWTDEDAAKLFALPLFQRYELPQDKNAGGDAAYWAPVIGAYTGAHITEIAQLLIIDIQREAGQWYIRFQVTEAWQRLTHAASHRTIPMHAELVRLGLPEFARACHASGQSRLFSALAVSALNNAGGGLSKWFSSLKHAAGFGPAHTFRGWRNTVETKLQRAREGQPFIDRYLGHQARRREGAGPGWLKPADLIETAARLKYEGLRLPKVYRVPSSP